MADLPRQTAFEILLEIEERNSRIDAVLNANLAYSGFSRRDRAFVSEIVYGVTRHKRALDTILLLACARPLRKVDTPVLQLLRAGLYQAVAMSKTPVSASVNETVNIAKANPRLKKSAGFINGVLRSTLRKAKEIDAGSIPDYVRKTQKNGIADEKRVGEIYSFPDWISGRWIRQFGVETAERIMRESNRQAPVFIRVNRLKSNLAKIKAMMDKKGIEAEPVEWAKGLLKVTKGSIFPGSELVAGGFIQPQDGASYMAAKLLGARPGDIVADVCCGKGIKSGLFAEMMQNRGVLDDYDVKSSNIGLFLSNMARLGALNCRLIIADMTNNWPVKRKYNKIFIDAPCSGTGVLRRHPEGKWNKSAELIDRMAGVQSKILSRAGDYLGKGGSIVYAVCSIEPEEGEEQVERFLSKRPDFIRANLKDEAPELVDYINEKGDLFILPGDGGMDGFFSAKITKRG
ncbi:16S rRNA (cytosine(967)-C(5))-methyltransferase [hydrothermal vent metagenome]|uniref:16S rRNA (cytosine(967)-C(5))-methyltransferase n=1 Tax=hydrothermal vent metagenome TaxID=652676 RepID=A0A3B1CTJ2_9ZZZZ